MSSTPVWKNARASLGTGSREFVVAASKNAPAAFASPRLLAAKTLAYRAGDAALIFEVPADGPARHSGSRT